MLVCISTSRVELLKSFIQQTSIPRLHGDRYHLPQTGQTKEQESKKLWIHKWFAFYSGLKM